MRIQDRATVLSFRQVLPNSLTVQLLSHTNAAENRLYFRYLEVLERCSIQLGWSIRGGFVRNRTGKTKPRCLSKAMTRSNEWKVRA